MTTFVHLHTHSQYSILDASASLPALVKKAASLGMPALALTDHGNLFGAIDFYKLCKEHSIKPIIGCEFFIAPHSRFDKKKVQGTPVAYHLTLLAKNNQGYHNLCKLSSIGYTEGFYYYPRIDFEVLSKHADGIICLSGCLHSPISQAILNASEKEAKELIASYQSLFKEDFYFELQRHRSLHDDLQLDGVFEEPWLYHQYQEYIQKQEKLLSASLKFSSEFNIPCVATNNVHYIERRAWKAHEILLNVQSGEPVEYNGIANPKRATFASHEMYFKTREEMDAAFESIPEALEASLHIAERCHLELDFKTKHYPVFIPDTLTSSHSEKERIEAVEKFLRKLATDGIKKRYTEEQLLRVQQKYPEKDPLEVVHERLEYEMNIICSKGMCDYLLIVWDFINWAKRHGIPMGPGRGSGVGSIILYLIEITDIEPLQFNLFFERFINPERLSYPDIDVDICMARRSEVIQYTIQKYGKENVAQIITFGSMKARMCVKDVGRALNVPLSKVNQIAKLIPEDLNITLEKALEKDQDLKAFYDTDSEAKKVIDIGMQLEGSIRSTGIHAAGMIVSAKPLVENIPICTAKDEDMYATQFPMKPVEAVGMLKIDFLGLKTLTCIQFCVDSIYRQTGKKIDWVNLPLDDEAAFSLLNQGMTLGVFQIETGGMKELSKQLHLDKFEEIIAVLSLYRPGPMDMIPSFIARKHKREPIEYDHPLMEEILSETYGIMVYQEQVMQIAQKLASFSLGEGDVLRRAMGKKDMKEMAMQREKFTKGAMKNGIAEEIATKVFDKMEKFAEYGFNKSHAAAYGYLTYVTAYLKANFPSQWLAALMTCDQDDITKVARLFHESRQMHIPILPPDINESDKEFVATSNAIRFAMSSIKGVGEGVVVAIIEERKQAGPFKNLYDFISRIDLKRVGKKAIELLIDVGCFDATSWHRDALKASVEAMYDYSLRKQKETAQGVLSLFDKIETKSPFATPPQVAKLRTKEELLLREKELLGFFLTGHPLDSYSSILPRLGCITLAEAEKLSPDSVFRAAFVIEEVQIRTSSKSQKKFAIVVISDGGIGKYELPVWPDVFEEVHPLLVENRLLWAVISKEKREESTSLTCRWLGELRAVCERDIELASSAYDKAKEQLMRLRKTNSSKATYSAKKKPEVLQAAAHYTVHINIDQLRASHILKIQKLFRSSGGTTPVLLRFSSQEQEIAALEISSTRGIALTSELEEELRKIPCVIP
jgi:DNA polymerase-3 subunit alpha